ncbi:MAG: hypothetical protein HY658_07145 [Actinobacteria bacterium]|nr:hypothetical protein [Actinomycetota bacterium]
MRGRGWIGPYHVAGRLWLFAAALSLLLPTDARLGLWLPVHLALAGAVSVSISGNLLSFTAALAAAPAPGTGAVATQFALVNAGAALVAAGMPAGIPWLVGLGGSLFGAGMLLLAALALRTWRRALNRRHVVTVFLYGSALAAVLAGVALGALLGAGAVRDAQAYLALRSAHQVLNVLGFASLTIAGTLVTFLPTVLRVRMPAWRGSTAAALLASGVAALAGGLALRADGVAAAGAVAFALGMAGLAAMAVRTARMPRRWPVPVAAKHLVAAMGWGIAGSVALAVRLVAEPGSFTGFRDVFLSAAVAGWVIQTLLGAWQYLLPVQRPGHPDRRRRALAAVEIGGNLQVLVGNAGLLAVVLEAGGLLPSAAGALGAWVALAAGAVALAKAWTHPWLARLPGSERRAARMWPT